MKRAQKKFERYPRYNSFSGAKPYAVRKPKITNKVHDLIRKEKGKDPLVIIADWNAVAREGQEDKIGAHGLGTRNGTGNILWISANKTNKRLQMPGFRLKKRRYNVYLG